MIKKGVTLIEIIAAISIIAIVFAVALPSYNTWRRKASIESDITSIYGLLNKYRTKAFSEKTSFSTVISSNEFNIKDESNSIVDKYKMKNSFTFVGSPVSIDKRGTFSGSSIKPTDLTIIPRFNCISVDDTAIKRGKWNNATNKCEY